jgi:hypothetical protein
VSTFLFGYFPENMKAVSDEHGKSFDQVISQTERRYSVKWSPYLVDYCWSLTRETPTGKNKMQKMK